MQLLWDTKVVFSRLALSPKDSETFRIEATTSWTALKSNLHDQFKSGRRLRSSKRNSLK